MKFAPEPISVTARVWDRLLAQRDRFPEPPPVGWSAGEQAAWALYAPLLGPAEAPFVLAQVGQSLDGRVGTPAGDCREVSGPDGLAHLHRTRALVQGVLVGATTVLADDPRLTVRLAEGPDPARLVVDPHGRVPADASIWAAGSRRIAIQACEVARPEGVEIVRIRHDGEQGSDPRCIASALAALGIRRILVEGGARTIAKFLDSGLLDRLHVAISPKIIGSGPAGLARAPISLLADAITPEATVYPLGSDVLFDCALRRR
ncbi:RibD family protein [Propylenella binzhouense]|uniref:RibD family protein n=1 Tax=Propylenella binzhouense TaxID=2555902 RepID=A0A964T8B4_9HYPH|nr:RibD family protein [Propylenella binzhouense]MYZ50319.1 RibD family protein [Propylenella binzhouense]